ncbi:hypothetical protein OKW22_000194 [Bacilli bacterium PM5-3]|nr:hypothetical protein [Bacilli bacterium PM5-3]MDH6603615.1 hypothetical protein [Bacilli bacterium PM5-9]
MNSKYIKDSVIFAFFTYLAAIMIIPLLSLLFNGLGVSFDADATTIQDVVAFLIRQSFVIVPAILGIVLIYQYNYLVNEKKNSIISQTPVSEAVKFLAPVFSFFSIGLIIDIILFIIIKLLDISFDDNMYFIIFYLKYFVLSFGLLFMVTSKNQGKLAVLVLIACFAVVTKVSILMVPGSYILLEIITVLISIGIVLIAFSIHLNWLKKHNTILLDVLYYIEVFSILFIFFRTIFITKYPIVTNDLALNIGGYSISLFSYLIIILLIITITYFQNAKFDVKKILVYLAPVLVITLIYVGVSSVGDKNIKNCEKRVENISAFNIQKNDEEYFSLSVNNEQFMILNVNGKQDELKNFLKQNIKSCPVNNLFVNQGRFFESNQTLNKKMMKEKNEVLIEINGSSMIFNNDDVKMSDIVDKIENSNAFIVVNFILDNKKYTFVYAPEKATKQEIDKYVSNVSKDNKLVLIDSENKKELFNKILISYETEGDDQDRYADVLVSNGKSYNSSKIYDYETYVYIDNEKLEYVKQIVKESGE